MIDDGQAVCRYLNLGPRHYERAKPDLISGMDTESPEYKLRCELHGHQEDVRAVCVGEIGVITSSRDSTIKVWAEEGPTAYSLVHTLAGHSKYVGAVAYAEPRLIPDMPNGAIVSGSFDAAVMVWDAASAAPMHTYKGHQYQVTAVVVLPNGDIASSSVDSTIRLWRGGKQVGELRGHEGPVLCLAVTESGDLISGSGDHTLKRWQAKSCVATYKGHTDTVRGVCLLPGVGFVSGSHDCSLRVWSLSGDVLAELLGHTAIIYTVAAAGSGGVIASGSEDNTVRLWSAAGSALQVLPHPGCVWSVAFTSAGDLVSGCSDAVGRLWSGSPERQDAEAAASFTSLLEERSAAAAAASSAAPMDTDGGAAAGGGGGLPPGLKVAEAFELAQPGAKAGETKLVREGDGSVAAYGWQAEQCVWEKIGTVVDAPEPGSISSGARRWYAGREWDHVFDVEMDSGIKLQLALDVGENPYIVADRFLAQHDLPAGDFKDQIVKFILDNTGSSKPGAAALADLPITGGFCDPFTGGSSSSSEPRQQQQQRPAAPQAAAFTDITGGGVDPFTGGASSSTRPPAAAAGQLPARAYLLFDAAPPAAGLRKKLLEFSAALQQQPDVAPDTLLTEAETAEGGLLDQLLACLPAAVAAPAAAAAGVTAVPAVCLQLLSRLLRWPAAQLFPVLDVARCLVLDPAAAATLAAGAGSMATPLLGGLSGGLAAAAVSGAAAPLQTGLRLAANCFKTDPLRAWLLDPANRELLLDGFAGCCSAGGPGATKGVRLSAATLLLNYAVAAAAGAGGGGGGGLDEAGGMQLLSGCEELLGQLPPDEGDAALRAVLALGSLCVAGGAAMVGLAKDLGVAGQLGRLCAGGGGSGQQQQLAVAVREVQQLLK